MISGLDLGKDIRPHLQFYESFILMPLALRAEHPLNEKAYFEGSSGIIDETGSFFEVMLHKLESTYALLGRYEDYEEWPFTDNLPMSERIHSAKNISLHISNHGVISQTSKILKDYFALLREICPPGDNDQYGSSSQIDIDALQCIAARVHCGLYVAEAKYLAKTGSYVPLIQETDRIGLRKLLFNGDVEETIIQRVRREAKTLSSMLSLSDSFADEIAKFYKNTIINSTMEVEIAYLLQRNN